MAARRFAVLNPIQTTNWLPAVDGAACTGCGACAAACPVEAVGMVSANDARRPKGKKARVDDRVCLGCGVCVRVCPTRGILLEARAERVITPVNSLHRIVSMAIERGNFQDLLFDNRALFSHRAMAAVLGAILKLSPIKQVLASHQIKSRYLETLAQRVQV